MAKKGKKQTNRQSNIQNARQRAAARARTTRLPVEEVNRILAEDTVEIVDLPDDPLAGEAIRQIAETTDSQAAGAAVAAAEAAESAAADQPAESAEPVERVADGIVIADADNAADLLTPDKKAAAGEGDSAKDAAESKEDSASGEAGKKRRRIPIWGKILIGIVIVIILVACIGLGLVNRFLSRIGRTSDEDYTAEYSEDASGYDTEIDEDASPLDTMDPNDITWYGQTIEPMQDDDIKNILLIGQDRRDGESRKRSDAMIIVSINQETGKIKICSLMRDMYVQIPDYGGGKLNYAYERGGMDLLDQTIEENLGVTIDNNVEVDFNGFVEAMSVVGDLDIYLSQAEIDFMEAHPTWADDSGADVTTWDLHEGLNTMTPDEYAVFCRLRMIGNNDFERTERQRRVLSAAFNKVIDGGVFNMLSVADAIIPYITTDMTNSEILGYVYTVVTKGMELSSQYRIPLDGTWTNQTIHRAAVLVCDMETNTKALQEFLYGDEEGVAFTSEEDRAQQKESGTFTTDSYGSSTSSSSSYSSGYSSYSSGYSSYSSTTTTPEDTTTTDPATDAQAVDGAAVVTDPTAVDGTAVTTDPASVTDPAAAVTDEQAAAAAAAAQAVAAQQAAEQAAAQQAAAAAQQAAYEQALAEQAAAAAAAAGTTTTP